MCPTPQRAEAEHISTADQDHSLMHISRVESVRSIVAKVEGTRVRVGFTKSKAEGAGTSEEPDVKKNMSEGSNNEVVREKCAAHA